MCWRADRAEFLQQDATPENLCQALSNYIECKDVAVDLGKLFADMHLALRQNAAERAADAVLSYLATNR